MRIRGTAFRTRISVAVGVGSIAATTLIVAPAAAAASCPNGSSPHRCNVIAATDAGGDAVGSIYGAVSGDGAVIAFATSGAVPGGSAGQQIYRRVLGSQTYTLVSAGPSGVAGNGISYAPAVSDDGSVIAFISQATNLVALDGNGPVADAFVRRNGTTTMLSSTLSPLGADGTVGVYDIAISGDGSTIAFVSDSTNLTDSDPNGELTDIYVHREGALTRIGGNGDSFKPSLNHDGTVLAFASDASNLVSGDTNDARDVFVRDLSGSPAIHRISLGPGGVESPLNADSGNSAVSISDDGLVVAFDTDATNLFAGDANSVRDIVIRTIDEDHPDGGVTTSIGYDAGAGVTDASQPRLSGDGTIVAFRGNRPGLVPGDVNAVDDVFIAGVAGGIQRLDASFDPGTGATTPIPGGTTTPGSISDDGRVVMIDSTETLAGGDDTNGALDAYAHVTHLLGPSVDPTPASINDPTPTITGTLQGGGDAIEVRDQATGTVVGFQQTSGTDAFSVTLDPLAEGPHTLSFREIDAPFRSPAVLRSLTIDTSPPELTILAPGDGATVGSATPTVSGTSSDFGTVDVSIENLSDVEVASCAAAVQPGGTWSCQTSPALPSNGIYRIEARLTDAASNQTTTVATFTLNAGVPTIAILAPLSGATNDGDITIAGTLEGASSLTLTIDGPGGTDTEPLSGASWSTTRLLADDGTYAISASATNVAGTGTSNTVTLVLDTIAPAAPTITFPANGAVITTNAPLIAGTAEPGSTVLLAIDGSPVAVPPVADGAGAWSHQTSGLSQGSHTLGAAAQDPAGNTGPTTSTSFSLDSIAPAAPVITTPVAGSTLAQTMLTVRGFGEAGATLTLREGTTVRGSTTVSPAGNWQLDVTFAAGVHTIRATQTDSSGLTGPASPPVSFTIDLTAIPTTIGTPLQHSVYEARDVIVAGRAARNGNVQLSVIEQGGATPLPGTIAVNAHGDWATTIRLNDGTHTLRAVETATMSTSPDRTFTVRSGIPVITGPASGAVVGSPFDVTGTALPGAQVTIRAGGTVLATVIADAQGVWSGQVTGSNGSVTLIAHAGSGASRSEDSDPVTITVDTLGPSLTLEPNAMQMGTLIGPAVGVHGTATDAHTVVRIELTYTNVLTGQTFPSTTLECIRCGDASSTVYTDAPALTPGFWTASARGQDEVGNVGLPATTRFIVLP